MAQAVRNHNDAQIPIGLHDVHVLSYCFNPDDDLHMAFTTTHNLLNWARCRALNSGLPVCMRMDAAFKLNCYKMCMYYMGFGELHGDTINGIIPWVAVKIVRDMLRRMPP